MLATTRSTQSSFSRKNFQGASLLVACALISVYSTIANAAPFTTGNLAVVRAGEGTNVLANTGNTIFIEEYTTNGIFVQSIAVPDNGTNALIVSGSATSEGALSRSADGRSLAFTGYNTNRPHSASLAASLSAVVPRGVGILNGSGNYSLAATTTNQFSANNIRGAATDGTNNFWAGGGNSGTYYFGFGSGTNTIQSTVLNTRVLNIVNGSLFFGTGSGTTRGIYAFDSAQPTTPATATNMINAGATASPYAFSINSAGTVAYIADDSVPASNGGLQKWTNSGTAWILAYIVNTNASRGLAVDWSGANPVLYATTTTNSIITVTDTNVDSAATLLVSGTTNTAFRGIAFAPTSPPPLPAFSYQDTDLLLVFRKTGFNDLLFNLGSVSNYLGRPNGTALAVTNFDSARLQANFSGNLTGVKYALLAVTTASDSPLRVWMSDAAPGVVLDQTSSRWSSQRSKINAVGVRAAAYGPPEATNQSLSLPPGNSDSYTYIASTGGSLDVATLSGAAPFPVEQDLGIDMRFFEIRVSTLNPKPASVQVGHFNVALNGTVSFIGGIIAPSITSQPANQTNAVGTNAAFSVSATGDEPLAYQWYFNSGAILGANGSSYNIASVSSGDAGNYFVVVSNAAGSATSSVATLTIPSALAITQPPASLAVCERFPASFSVTAIGDAPLSYQWRFNSNNISGATGSSYTIASAATNNAGSYDVVVSNTSGSITSAVATLTVQTTFAGFVNKGLVGVGRVSANSFDPLGAGVDTLGGIFSGMFFEQATLVRTGTEANGYTYSGTLYALPDRGFGDGAQDFHARVETLSLSITPYYGSAPTSQTQIAFAPVAATLFTYGGTNFTGYDPDDLTITNFPQSTPGSLGAGKRSLDAEGIVRTADGGFFISDEYGPMIARFNASGALQYTLFPPEGLVPKRGAYPGTTVFTGTNNPTSGRRSNRGFEGVTLMPDGKRLATVLQSPAIQDGGANNPSRNTRLLIFDIDPVSATFGRAIAEYVYHLTLNAAMATNRHTPLSEVLALNNDQFLVLERDGIGLGVLPAATPIYKRVNVLSTRGATNIINTGYDLEFGAPGSLALPQGALPASVGAAQRFDLVDIIDTNQLVKFGLNINTNQDNNTIGEKWEGLALIPLNEPAFPNDYLLLVGNDNDFKATNVYHNGVVVGTNDVTLDNMLLAYRVTIGTGCGDTNTPQNVAPTIAIIGPTNATLSAPATVTLTASAYDQDGLVTNVNFYLAGGFIGNDTTFPFQFTLNGVAAGNYDFTAVAFDQSGASGTSIVKTVVVTVNNLAPTVAMTAPANGANVRANANLPLAATAGDADGSVTNVAFYEGTTLIGSDATAPFTANAPNIAVGAHSYYAVAYDNQGAVATSAVVSVTAYIAPAITQQPVGGTITVGGDFTFSVTATGDAPLSYQWRLGTNNISGATDTSLSLSNVPLSAAGNYTVVISNLGGSITSAVAVLVVKAGFTYQDTDLLLVFRKTGFNDLLFNLGSVSNYLGRPNGTALAVTNFDSARLQANFSNNLSGVKYALLSVTPADDAVLRVWMSDAAPGAVLDQTSSRWSSQRSKINAVGVRATAYGYPAATNQSLSVPPSDPNSYTYIASTGGSLDVATLSGAAPFPVEQDVTNTVRFFEIKVSTLNPKPAAVQVGAFFVAVNGSVTFTAGTAPPIAGPDAIQRYAGSSVKVPVGELLLNDTDPDLDPITLVSVGGTANATVTIEGPWVVYTPNAGFTSGDTFTYSISDGRGGIGTGVVTVTITTDTLPTFNNTITAQGGGSFRIAFSGIPGRIYTIQYTDSLSPPNWQFLGTRTANAVGFFEIIDTPPGGTRFYRTVYP